MEEGLGGKEGDGGRMGVTGAREQGAMCVAGVTASSPVSLYLLRLINNSISITKAQVLQAWAPPPLVLVIHHLLCLEARYGKELTGAATFPGASVTQGLDI